MIVVEKMPGGGKGLSHSSARTGLCSDIAKPPAAQITPELIARSVDVVADPGTGTSGSSGIRVNLIQHVEIQQSVTVVVGAVLELGAVGGALGAEEPALTGSGPNTRLSTQVGPGATLRTHVPIMPTHTEMEAPLA